MRLLTLASAVILAPLVLAAQVRTGESDAAFRRLPDGRVELLETQAAVEPPPASAGADPDLEPGFPVQTFYSAGSFQGTPAIHTLVADVDGDSALEIVRTGLADGPLYAWNHDGTAVPGWPATAVADEAYPVWGTPRPRGPLGKRRGLVFSGHSGRLVLWRADGAPWFPAWPRIITNDVVAPPTMADLDGDGADEILVGEEDWALHAYNGDATIPAGWPVQELFPDQERFTPAVADLDGVAGLEIVTAAGWADSINSRVFGYRANGSILPGFPLVVPTPFVRTFPVIGDVDGDGEEEIVIAHGVSGNPPEILVFSRTGVLERALPTSGTVLFTTAPALADLTGDGIPEIVVQTESTLEVLFGTGGSPPGWPQPLGDTWIGSSAPVIGDVTGDGQPDIAIATQVAGSASNGHVWLFHKTGAHVAGFPKALPIGFGAVPAIADIDLDGRNELVVTGNFWNGVPGVYDTVWVYDLHGENYGPVLWGQFMGGPRHQGRYGQPQQ